MPRKDSSGWFVEVPIELKAEFKRRYKGRAAMRKLTIAAIEWAIREYPRLKLESDDNTTHARSDNSD